MSAKSVLRLAAFLAVGLLMLTKGCGVNPKPAAQTSQVAVTSREQAIALATQEVIRRGWKEIEIERVDFEPGVWEVCLWSLPKVPGGFAIVKVSTNGTIIEFRGGR